MDVYRVDSAIWWMWYNTDIMEDGFSTERLFAYMYGESRAPLIIAALKHNGESIK